MENLTLIGVANINGTGNSNNNVIIGNSGNNILSGLAGNDTLIGDDGNDTLNGGTGIDNMDGGFGNDTYIVDAVGDIAAEVDGGVDSVQASVSYTLSTNLENLRLTDAANINGTGNSNNNVITGNSGNNILIGLAGNDTLLGNDGNDTLNGGTGIDNINGGAGKDTMSGADGNDIYRYFSTSESAVGTQKDVILDFTRGFDKLDLSFIDADLNIAGNQAFTFIGSSSFSGTLGEARFFTSGGNLFLQAEINGDGNSAADMEIQLNGLAPISATDIIL